MGFLALVVLAACWSTALSDLEVGAPTGLGAWWGDSPEKVAARRASINQSYILWVVVTLIGTALAAYVTREIERNGWLLEDDTANAHQQAETEDPCKTLAELEKKP